MLGRVLNKRYLILPTPASEVSKGGLYLPTGEDLPMNIGTVVGRAEDCGTDRNGEPCATAEVGETVYYAKMAGLPITIDDVEHHIVSQIDVLYVEGPFEEETH